MTSSPSLESQPPGPSGLMGFPHVANASRTVPVARGGGASRPPLSSPLFMMSPSQDVLSSQMSQDSLGKWKQVFSLFSFCLHSFKYCLVLSVPLFQVAMGDGWVHYYEPLKVVMWASRLPLLLIHHLNCH